MDMKNWHTRSNAQKYVFISSTTWILCDTMFDLLSARYPVFYEATAEAMTRESRNVSGVARLKHAPVGGKNRHGCILKANWSTFPKFLEQCLRMGWQHEPQRKAGLTRSQHSSCCKIPSAHRNKHTKHRGPHGKTALGSKSQDYEDMCD